MLDEFEIARQKCTLPAQTVLNIGRNVVRKLRHRQFDSLHLAFVYVSLPERFNDTRKLLDAGFDVESLSEFLVTAYPAYASATRLVYTPALLRTFQQAERYAALRPQGQQEVTDHDVFVALVRSQSDRFVQYAEQRARLIRHPRQLQYL